LSQDSTRQTITALTKIFQFVSNIQGFSGRKRSRIGRVEAILEFLLDGVLSRLGVFVSRERIRKQAALSTVLQRERERREEECVCV
jgi:hypothetical protein